ncbi:S-adenosyl-L-methionine-dependent methyltransferase [Aspergillus eucalypticola CBS 122712]|uniref:S-adenosyl-L-methionine-dependent methyltransferase n=1 Tax=Aspergillus eucalypticola (strain CBS 122712 / IBT 29274) TaxID=1448314 RepID=A0A317VPD4_ASPEC|nr:S-adenosyl-L-methionine-dependent methyltransferase [Aspergillus eucalypticola CBS 122712]PWY75785.1 S-adenosyl-L-methionine-dependent methyltransferase [Aspergillus eucalypticola CBS 122712]
MAKSTSPPNDVLGTLNAINADSFSAEGDRINALLAAYALVSRLETPWERIARMCMGEPALSASLKVVKDLRLFEKWHADGDGARSGDELAALANCERDLLGRILRHLATNHILIEPTAGVFKPTTFSLSLLQPVFGEWISFLFDVGIPVLHKTPEFLQKTGYKNPTDPKDVAFQYAKGYQGDMFDYFTSHPREGASFNHVMGGVMAHQASWLEIIPAEHFTNGSDPNGPLVVDVGGNIGHDIEKFRQVHPETAHRLYLQDLTAVVKLAKCPDPVNKMAHNFFQPQPVLGSRIYYMHAVLHDWSDEPARQILKMIRDAMKPGYSRLLVHDHVVPEKDAHPHATAYDLTMMALLAGVERTETQWRDLLSSVGYRVVKVWRSPLAAQAIIEAVIAD